MKIYGQLERAQIEVLSADPAGAVNLAVGRVWFNKTDGYAKIADEGNVVTKFLLNDDKIIIGTSGTAANNVRLNRAGAGILQLVLGSDITAEASISATPAILSSRQEHYLQAGLPAVGNSGRLAYVTDQAVLKVDSGAVWETILTSSGATFDAQSKKIINGVDPIAAQDIATKNYVDTNSSTNGQIPVTTKSANYTVLTSDQLILCNSSGGTFTLTLYTAVGNSGKKLKIKKIDLFGNPIIIDPNGAETIDGEATVNIRDYNEVLEIVSDGTNWVTHGWYDQSKYFIAREEQPAGTDGGAAVTGSFQARVLNTVKISANWASLAANQITLQPGSYRVVAHIPGATIDQFTSRLRNITDASSTLLGTSEYNAAASTVKSVIDGTFTITAAKVFEVQYRATIAGGANGLGVSTGFQTEVYTTITIERINPRSS